jgi:hypothetical protein
VSERVRLSLPLSSSLPPSLSLPPRPSGSLPRSLPRSLAPSLARSLARATRALSLAHATGSPHVNLNTASSTGRNQSIQLRASGLASELCKHALPAIVCGPAFADRLHEFNLLFICQTLCQILHRTNILWPNLLQKF